MQNSRTAWVRLVAITLAVWAMSISMLAAADTGSVSGAAFDQNGEPVAEATVKISGDTLPAGRTVQTGTNGLYQFLYLLPGAYVVDIEKAGVGTSRRAAIVEVGKDTQLDFVLGLAVQEALTVTAAMPTVDSRTAEIGFNFKDDTLNSLPLERTYRGLFQLIPGVADNRSPVGPSAGGSRQDNVYLIDGANITSPAFGYLGTEINELDIAEVNIKRGGVSAEFGRTSGTVVNAVSRSGSNRFMGVGRIDWLTKHLVNAYELPTELLNAGVRPGAFQDPLLSTAAMPAVGVGGPLIRDRMFFYGSLRYSRETKWDRVNRVGVSLPDEVQTAPEYFGKLTLVPTAQHQMTGSYRFRPSHTDDASLNSDVAPSLATQSDDGTRVATSEWAYFPGSRRSINVRYVFMKEINEDVPVRNLGQLPPFDVRNLSAMGQYTDSSQANLIVGAGQFTNVQNYYRHEVRATFGEVFDIGTTNHSFKAGIGLEFTEDLFSRTVNGWGAIVSITQDNVPALRARYYEPQAPQIGRTSTHSVFLQDEVVVSLRTSVTAGILLNRDEFGQHVGGSGGCPSVALTGGPGIYQSKGDTCKFLRFGFADEMQPRVGVTYQLSDKRGDKAYAHWGRYYGMDQKSSARSLAPRRIYQTQTVFDLTGAVLSTGPLASTTGKLIDPDLKPIYSDEFVAGYATPLGGTYSLDVFFMSRRMNHFIEDVPSRMSGTTPTSGPYVAANLPCTRFAACSAADARRHYRAVTFDFRRGLANGWLTNVNYTWSRFEGNFDLDFGTVQAFNTSSFIQDGPGANVEDPNRFGPLLEDRPHVLKVFTSYQIGSRVTASGYLRLQSGTPWTARGRDWAGSALNYLEPAGSHRNPTWTNFDLMGSYRLPLDIRTRVSLEARLLNVFNNQTRLLTDSQKYLDLPTIPAPPYFGPYQQPNPFFGLGSGFAPPRRLHIAAVISF
jgi:hypothetical protein